MKTEIIGWINNRHGDNTGNITVMHNGEKYVIATMEFYGGANPYGILKSPDDSFTSLSSKKRIHKPMIKTFNAIAPTLTAWLKQQTA